MTAADSVYMHWSWMQATGLAFFVLVVFGVTCTVGMFVWTLAAEYKARPRIAYRRGVLSY